MIQNSLRTNLGSDVTLFTIAHRLQTIMDTDKIVRRSRTFLSLCRPIADKLTQMVLDSGNIVQFGKPGELLKIEGGHFKRLVDESGDKDGLYKMAQ